MYAKIEPLVFLHSYSEGYSYQWWEMVPLNGHTYYPALWEASLAALNSERVVSGKDLRAVASNMHVQRTDAAYPNETVRVAARTLFELRLEKKCRAANYVARTRSPRGELPCSKISGTDKQRRPLRPFAAIQL